LNGELPTAEQYDVWRHDVTYHTFIHENVRKRFEASTTTHTQWASVSAVAALAFYLDAKDIFDPESRSKQIIRLIAKMPTLAAAATASAWACRSSTRTTRSTSPRTSCP